MCYLSPTLENVNIHSLHIRAGSHGWPSFRDEEVVWDNVRCLGDGEAVSVDGTHLGHNLPDNKGSRYCINLVSVAGRPEK
jgi:peptide methionine sulfoxide reductase MsrB